MNTFTTFLIVSNAITLLIVIFQRITRKRRNKIISFLGQKMERYKILCEFHEKRERQKYTDEQSLYSLKHKSN